MRQKQQVTGPVAPGQYNAMQVSGPTQMSDPTAGMFNAMMPMIMMVMMLAIIAPMLKGVSGSSKS